MVVGISTSAHRTCVCHYNRMMPDPKVIGQPSDGRNARTTETAAQVRKGKRDTPRSVSVCEPRSDPLVRAIRMDSKKAASASRQGNSLLHQGETDCSGAEATPPHTPLLQLGEWGQRTGGRGLSPYIVRSYPRLQNAPRLGILPVLAQSPRTTPCPR